MKNNLEGGEGGRTPAAAARHRRDHRHRLHRHGEPQEPRRSKRRCAAARTRPDEDVRRRDLAPRARGDDAPERHGRPARDPHEPLSHLRGRRVRGVGRNACAGDRAKASRPREGPACRRSASPFTRAYCLDRRPRRDQARGGRGGCPPSVLPDACRERSRPPRSLRRARTGKLDALRPTTPDRRRSVDRAEARGGRLARRNSGVGKVDHYEVVVAGGAKLVGKKVKLLVGRALESTAYATSSRTCDVLAITFEAEAERPTRAPSRKKAAEGEPEIETGRR